MGQNQSHASGIITDFNEGRGLEALYLKKALRLVINKFADIGNVYQEYLVMNKISWHLHAAEWEFNGDIPKRAKLSPYPIYHYIQYHYIQYILYLDT